MNDLPFAFRILEDPGEKTENRLDSLQTLEMTGLSPAQSPERLSYLGAALRALRLQLTGPERDEECLRRTAEELREQLECPRNGEQVCVICGKGWLADAVWILLGGKGKRLLRWEDGISGEMLRDPAVTLLICEETPISWGEEPSGAVRIDLWRYLEFRWLRFPQFYTIKREFERSASEDTAVVVTGMSYIRDAVQCGLLNRKAVSLANSSQDLFYDFQMFQYACARLKRPRYAVIGLAPYSLRYDESRSKVQRNRLFAYYAAVGSFHNCPDTAGEEAFYDREQEKIRLCFSEAEIDRIFEQVYVPLFGDGRFDDRETYEEEDVDSRTEAGFLEEMRGKFHKPYEHTRKENTQILREYLTFCQSRGIRALILLPPYSDWYKAHWDPAYREELLGVLDSFRPELDFEVLDLTAEHLDNCYFKEYAHVNRLGAIWTAGRINRALDRMENRQSNA